MDKAQSFTRPVKKRHRARLFKVGSAKAALADFDKGHETTCYTFGQFSIIDALVALMQKTGPVHVVIATWTAASADLRRAQELMADDLILSCRWVVDHSFANRQPEYLEKMVELFGKDSIRSLKTHAKFMLLYNEEWNIVVRTSMNLNENKRLENMDVIDSEDFCSWHRALVDGIFSDRRAGDFRDDSQLDLTGIADEKPKFQCEMGVASRGRVYEKGVANVGPL
ncbi:hypothetical protein [Corynebacterium phocae]|uniref:hypothetical protein n=1 Tax=Corynebacterium phocae TaxID=161895 RepID=UPI00123C4A0C|nr:hypothetical protein [Corynebacterium phocae]KAA8723008.1 hypothetical protein F4V58_06660 [Corynebacterium phocae]